MCLHNLDLEKTEKLRHRRGMLKVWRVVVWDSDERRFLSQIQRTPFSLGENVSSRDGVDLQPGELHDHTVSLGFHSYLTRKVAEEDMSGPNPGSRLRICCAWVKPKWVVAAGTQKWSWLSHQLPSVVTTRLFVKRLPARPAGGDA